MKKIKQRKLTKGEQILYNDLSDALKEIKSLRGYNVNLSRQLNEIKIEKNREWDKKQKIIYTLMGRLRDEREEKEQLNKDFALYRKNVKELINEYGVLCDKILENNRKAINFLRLNMIFNFIIAGYFLYKILSFYF